VTGYPHLARRHHVSAVPKTVAGDDIEFGGALPEAGLLQNAQETA
jgi:hypothetical protein